MDVSMALNGLRICWGVRIKGSRRLKCGEEVSDPRVVEETMKLINEFMNRVEKHRNVLLNESTTPFDNAINALRNWLMPMEEKIKDVSDEGIANLSIAMINAGRKMLRLAERAREKWLRRYKPELVELIEKLRGGGEAAIIIRGDPFNEDRSFMAHLYTKHLVVKVERVVRSGDVTVTISLTELGGVDVVTPKLFGDGVLRPMQYGLMLTDGAIHKEGYPEMTTDHLWQVMVWPLIWPGENRVCINGLGVNNGDVKITWHLTAMNYKDLTESKTKIAEEASKLDDEGFTTFLLFAVLGDASIIAKKGEEGISLTIGYSKYGLWKGVVDRMGGLGFKERDRKCLKAKIIGIYSSKAIILTRKWLSNPLIKALIEELSQLSDADKLRGGLIELANARVKPLGRSSIEVIDGISMNVHVTKDGYVELKTVRKSHEAAVAVQERLKSTGYDVELSIRGGKFTVYMGMDVIKKYPELAAKVCGVLRRMLNEATSEGNIERAWSIAKAMKNLNCQDPAQGPTGLKPRILVDYVELVVGIR